MKPGKGYDDFSLADPIFHTENLYETEERKQELNDSDTLQNSVTNKKENWVKLNLYCP